MRFAVVLPIFALAWAVSVRAAAPADCWALRKHGHSAEAKGCFETLTHSGDAYLRAEGFWGLEQWERANEQFRAVTQPAGSQDQSEEHTSELQSRFDLVCRLLLEK